MSSYLAIAHVTRALVAMVTDAANKAGIGADVKAERPEKSSQGQKNAGINVFLYQVAFNPAMRNTNLPTRSSQGELVEQPRLALDLYYMFSFHGSDETLDSQKLLAITLLALNAHPILTWKDIERQAQLPGVTEPSDPGEQDEKIRLSPIQFSLEELSKMWSVFFQIPYMLSVAYKVSVVILESAETFQTALPVRAPSSGSVTSWSPVIRQVLSDAGTNQPILANSTLLILGQRLLMDSVQVRIGGVDVTPFEVKETAIRVRLPDIPPQNLRAGVQSLQIVQPLALGNPPTLHQVIESNIATFALHPRINRQAQGKQPKYAITKSGTTDKSDKTFTGNIKVTVTPQIGRTQQVALLLNQIDAPSGSPLAYTFPAPPRSTTAPDAASAISIPIKGVLPGAYLVRLQVDGAESILDFDGDRYSGPQVKIP